VIDRHNNTINFLKLGLCSVYLGPKLEFLTKIQGLYLIGSNFYMSSVVRSLFRYEAEI
jgi:hypothetical protein